MADDDGYNTHVAGLYAKRRSRDIREEKAIVADNGLLRTSDFGEGQRGEAVKLKPKDGIVAIDPAAIANGQVSR